MVNGASLSALATGCPDPFLHAGDAIQPVLRAKALDLRLPPVGRYTLDSMYHRFKANITMVQVGCITSLSLYMILALIL